MPIEDKCMSVSVAPPIRHDARRRARLARIAVPAAIAAASFWSGPATAATAQTNLSVGAIVVASCTISTQARTGSTGSVSHSCSSPGQGSVAIAREPASSGKPAFPERPAAAASAGDSAPQADVRYITITY